MIGGGGIRRGLHIDDDDEPRKPDEHSKLEADRKKTNLEKDLDSMLFGGPAVRRPRSNAKPAEEANKAPPADNKPTGPAVVPVNPTPSNTKAPVAPVQPPAATNNNAPKPAVTQPTQLAQPAQPVQPTQPAPKITGTVTAATNPTTSTNVNKSGDSVKNSVNIALTGATVKIEAPKGKPALNTGHKEQVSVIVPSAINESADIKTIGIISKETLPAPDKKINNYVEPKASTKAESIEHKKEELKNKADEPKKVEPKKEAPVVPAQPAKAEEIEFLDKLHPFSTKGGFNRPGFLRKLKKPAEDFKFAEENSALHTAVDVVRPAETDRNKQKKLNDFDFKDFQFPAASISLGRDHREKVSVWKRPNQLAKVVNFGKYIDPNDLKAGSLSSPHFLSTLSGLSESEANIKRLIEDQKANPNGFYLVRLFINSVWRYIPVDSLLPFIDNENAGVLGSTDSQFELSSSLIEKAYAKVFGGYDTFASVHPREYYLRDLTGAPVRKVAFDNPDIGAIIKKALSAGHVVLAVPNEKIAALGINPNYSYNVTNFSAKGSVELRNSWGTIQERSKISHKAEGIVELASAQARDNINHVLIAQINNAYSTSTIQSKHRLGFYSSYNFKVRKDTHGFVTVSQWDNRLFPANSGYEYSPVHVVLQRTESDGHTTFVNAAFTAGARNLDLEVSLAAGSYTVFVAANWKGHEHSFNLSFYGAERIDFERVHTEKIPNLIGHSLEAINVASGRRTDLNKNTAQYFTYHPESNLVVLTVENTSERDGTATADLTKVKLEHLVLLTSHNNEDNYSSKVGVEVEEYKHIPITDRRWAVSLAAHGRFTWVLAADEPYSSQNPKRWGFS